MVEDVGTKNSKIALLSLNNGSKIPGNGLGLLGVSTHIDGCLTVCMMNTIKRIYLLFETSPHMYVQLWEKIFFPLQKSKYFIEVRGGHNEKKTSSWLTFE